MAVYLNGVPEVVEDGVESGGEAADGVEEGVGSPDAEDSGFLPEGLAAGYGLTIATTDDAACPELEDASGEADEGQSDEEPERRVGVHGALGADGNAQCEGDGP